MWLFRSESSGPSRNSRTSDSGKISYQYVPVTQAERPSAQSNTPFQRPDWPTAMGGCPVSGQRPRYLAEVCLVPMFVTSLDQNFIIIRVWKLCTKCGSVKLAGLSAPGRCFGCPQDPDSGGPSRNWCGSECHFLFNNFLFKFWTVVVVVVVV